MAIEPRLPLPAEDRNKPLEGDWMRMRRRLDELLRDMLLPKQYARGDVVINNTATSGSTTPVIDVSSSTVVAITGLSGGTAVDSVTAVLTISGGQIVATRTGTSGKLTVSYVAFNP